MDFGMNAIGGYYPAGNEGRGRAVGQAGGTSFLSVLSAAQTSTASSFEEYTEYLNSRYGMVMVQDVGKDQKSMDALGSRTSGTGNIVIATNILEEMAIDPEKADYYEKKIRYLSDSLPMHEAQLAAGGFEIQSRGMVVHPDGTVTYYISADLTPEKKAQVKAAMKAEDEAKAQRRAEYEQQAEAGALRRSERLQAADERHQEKVRMELAVVEVRLAFSLPADGDGLTAIMAGFGGQGAGIF